MRAHPRNSTFALTLALSVAATAFTIAPSSAAFALSEFQSGDDTESSSPSEIQRVPLPLPGSEQQQAPEVEPAPEQAPEQMNDGTGAPAPPLPQADPDAPPAEVIYDTNRLPEPVARLRTLILEAAKSGDIERLRPLIGSGETQTQLSLTNGDQDPVALLKQLSGDENGHEILAILAEVLEAGFVHLDVGTPQELYVWPYFFAVPLESLSAPQRVELFRIMTGGEYEEMKEYGAYVFYRVGITPAGEWSFFVSGE